MRPIKKNQLREAGVNFTKPLAQSIKSPTKGVGIINFPSKTVPNFNTKHNYKLPPTFTLYDLCCMYTVVLL